MRLLFMFLIGITILGTVERATLATIAPIYQRLALIPPASRLRAAYRDSCTRGALPRFRVPVLQDTVIAVVCRLRSKERGSTLGPDP